MNGHVGSALVRNRFLLLGFLSLSACAQEGSTELGALGSNLTAAAGSGASCMPLDSADTVPDGIDEDCDGKVDEDVDATRARCPRGTRILEGTRNDDTLRGTSGRDCILGYGGNDVIFGGSGDDVIFGGPGNDRIYTGRGNAVVRAGSGDDIVDTSGSLMSLVYGDAGNDTLTGGLGIDTLHGGEGNDRLNGGGGADILSGGGCHDSLVGGTFIDLGNGGPDFDACDTEISSDCERSRRSRVSCAAASDCQASERCAVHVGFCVPKSARECGATSCIPTSPNDVTCDGVDDDCDGAIDDDFVSEATSCGMGGCGSTGETSCVDGEVVDSCSPGSPLPTTDSVCDGLDDDCDGAADEGFVPTATTCGIGVCSGAGMRSCVAGNVVDSCQAGLPGSTTDTVCNGSDDDCDGATDEEFAPAATSCGAGVCTATGLTSCVDGALTDSCEPGDPISTTDTTCNAADDDCNGLVDDGYVGVTTTCGYGECEESGITVCASGYVVDSCVVECEGHCADGGEDDGDGAVDCADSDCAENPLWPQCVTGAVGSACETPADCLPGSDCSFDFPGGYCFSMCSAGCPAGSVCWEGVACVQPCVGPNLNACPLPGHECAPLVSSGSTFPFCRPTCEAGACQMGTCNADGQCS